MPLFPLPIEEFGGLNLVDAVDEIGFSGAIDMLNVDGNQHGRVRSRDGYSAFTAVAGPNGYDSVIGFERSAAGFDQVVAGAGNRLEALDSASGTLVASSALPTANPHFFTRFGTSSAEYVYIANGTDRIRRWDGATFTEPAGLAAQTGKLLAVQTPDNRLVHARTNTNKSRVAFSNAGDPETFGANNWVDIRPGDGEEIRAVVSWHDLLFVFKQSCFAVFYGNSLDANGNPIFDNRIVQGTGAIMFGGAVAHTDGVYFVSRDGIYKTTGGPPVCVSDPIAPLFRYVDSQYYLGPVVSEGAIARLTCVPASLYGRIYVPLAPTIVLVYDGTGWIVWTLAHETTYFTTLPDSAVASAPRKLLFPRTAGFNDGNHIYSQQFSSASLPAPTTDAGRAITSRYQSGFDNIAPPRRFAAHYLFGNTRKRLRKWKVTGTGTVNFAIAHDFGSPGTASSLTLGTSPAIADRWHNIAARGQLFSYKLSSTSAWNVQKLTAYLAGSEPPLLGNPSDK